MDHNSRFDRFKERFIEDLWKMFPEWAASVGYYEYADRMTIPNDDRRTQEVDFYTRYLDSLGSFMPDSLTDANRVDWVLIENQLSSGRWRLTDFKGYQWNPSIYNVAGGTDLLLSGSFAPLDERLMLVFNKIRHVPGYYRAAKSNITDPTREHTELAIKQNRDGIAVFDKSLRDSVLQSGLDEPVKTAFNQRIDSAIAAIQGFADWLEVEELPALGDEVRSFRIGPELYEKKFRYDLMASSTADEIYERALEEKEDIHTEMLRITQALWPDYFGVRRSAIGLQDVKRLIGEISKQHVQRDSFLIAVERQLKDLEEFVIEKDLITLDPDKPLVVRPTPPYQRGVAGAGIDAPGPYEAERNTYYNVTPLDDYTQEQAESWLREYNYYTLQILNIHEAIPGHYTQLVYSNKSRSLIKSLFGNSTMVEGWACYTEKMMLEEGYGKDVPEMWLMYYKWRLRVLCNTLIDIGIHTKNMSEEEVLDLLSNEAFQEEAEARGKWKRAQYTSVQLCSYYIGLTEIYDLREEMKGILGTDFNLKQWHEDFLSYGSAPVKFIRELMLARTRKPA